MSQHHMKLTYFNFGGRAEITRLTLAFAGVSFDDNRVSGAEFGAIKATLPLGQVPVIDVNGTTFCQSMAIARYAGRVTGMYPEDALDALKVDEVVETTMDAFNMYVEVNWRTPEAEKAAKVKKLTEEDLPKIVGYLEKKVQGKFFLGEKATIADMFLFDLYMNGLKPVFPDFKVSAFPKVDAVLKNVAANAGIQAYLAKHAL